MFKNESIVLPELVDMPDDANFQVPDRDLLTYYRFAKDRIFFIDYEIDDYLMLLIKEIIRINIMDKGKPVEERKPIVIGIKTYGGNLDVTYSFIDVCAGSKTPIYTVNLGAAMSAGLLIFLAGHKRYCLEHSTAMIHSGSAGFEGTYEQIEASQKSYEKQVKKMRDYIISRSHIDAKLFARKKKDDWYIESDEQVSLGIADKVIEGLDEVF